MLRITEEVQPNGLTCLRLEGSVVGPWVEELARSSAAVHGLGKSLNLDITGVSFLDPKAVRLVRGLRSLGVSLHGCSPFVSEQIDGGSDDATKR